MALYHLCPPPIVVSCHLLTSCPRLLCCLSGHPNRYRLLAASFPFPFPFPFRSSLGPSSFVRPFSSSLSPYPPGRTRHLPLLPSVSTSGPYADGYGDGYDSLMAEFTWPHQQANIQYYNIGVDICDKWATSDKKEVQHTRQRGARVYPIGPSSFSADRFRSSLCRLTITITITRTRTPLILLVFSPLR